MSESSPYESRSPSYYEPHLRWLRPFTPPLLDLGAGYGLFLECARMQGIEGVGVELSSERVKLCRSKGLNVIEHNLGDRLPFDDNSFGMIYCGQVIEHLTRPTQETMLREAHRVLKPGGKFQVRSPCRHLEKARQERGHIGLLTPSELEAMLRVAGFTSINLDNNFPQDLPGVPDAVVKDLWKRYRPDLLSQSANAVVRKTVSEQN